MIDNIFNKLERIVRGFESPSHRHILKKSLNASSDFFFLHILQREGVRSPDGVRQLAQPVGQRSLRRCPQGERSESIPLSPPHSKEESERKFRLFFCIFYKERG